MDNAFKYIIANNGIDTEASYPYTAQDGSCHYSASNIGATLSSYQDIPQGSESSLTNAIGTVGPVSVAIDASHSSFQFYRSGVYYEPACSTTELDHGVLAVGYGSSTADYYIVKNSWGTTWGMQGYILMSRNRNNNCGIATSASYPVA
jgi:cathepsin L